MEVATDISVQIAKYIRKKWIMKKKINIGFPQKNWDLVLSIGSWLDGGKSERELAGDCKKEFKWTKGLEKSCIHHPRDV